MRVERLWLEGYRNYSALEWAPHPDTTVLYGDNAQGKTNLLEALFLCCTGRAHRTPRERELIRWNQDYARVRLAVSRRDGLHSVEIRIFPHKRHEILVNGLPVKRMGEMLGHVNCVLFSPEDLRLVKDGPAERRRFMDMELSQLRPSYFYQLQQYSRVLTHRNALLKEIAFKPQLKETLPVWDEQMALLGGDIMAQRERFVEQLQELAGEIHRNVTRGTEEFQACYAPGLSFTGGSSWIERLHAQLEMGLKEDVRHGSTGFGPHRDDILLSVDGKDARAYASQGQQRTCALTLKLSELELMRRDIGEYPVLLLDDVMSELDESRREMLLTHAAGIQTVLTCTSAERLAGLDGRTILIQRVHEGGIREESVYA